MLEVSLRRLITSWTCLTVSELPYRVVRLETTANPPEAQAAVAPSLSPPPASVPPVPTPSDRAAPRTGATFAYEAEPLAPSLFIERAPAGLARQAYELQVAGTAIGCHVLHVPGNPSSAYALHDLAGGRFAAAFAWDPGVRWYVSMDQPDLDHAAWLNGGQLTPCGDGGSK